MKRVLLSLLISAIASGCAGTSKFVLEPQSERSGILEISSPEAVFGDSVPVQLSSYTLGAVLLDDTTPELPGIPDAPPTLTYIDHGPHIVAVPYTIDRSRFHTAWMNQTTQTWVPITSKVTNYYWFWLADTSSGYSRVYVPRSFFVYDAMRQLYEGAP